MWVNMKCVCVWMLIWSTSVNRECVCLDGWGRENRTCPSRGVSGWNQTSTELSFDGVCYWRNSRNCRLTANWWVCSFCSSFSVHCAQLLLIHHSQLLLSGWVCWSRSVHAMPWLLARHDTHDGVLLRDIQNAQSCWWATTCDRRDENSNPGPPGSEK